MTTHHVQREQVRDYSSRSELISDLAGLLKASRRPVDPQSAAVTHAGRTGLLFLDTKARGQLERLVLRLLRHQNFEYLSMADARKELLHAVAAYQTAYRNGQRLAIREVAATFLDDTAGPIHQGRVYLGVRHLRLSAAVDVGLARFVPAADLPFLERVVGRDNFEECGLYCVAEATGGTRDKILMRAERAALLAGSLLRLHVRRSSRDFVDEQLLFDLHPVHGIELDGGQPERITHVQFGAITLDLSAYDSDWIPDLEDEGRRIIELPARVRNRVYTALEWMDVAARAPTWKIRIPAIFFGLESLLVPEDCNYKAEVVTVRSVILQATLGDSFFHPDITYAAYLVRCNLVHGEPLEEDIADESQDLADSCAWWAQDIITDYVTYASTTASRDGRALVRHLDQSDEAGKACQWFVDNGADEIVRNYRAAVGLPPFEH